MSKWITAADIRLFKGITLNVNEGKDLDPHIKEAQDFELRPFLGESFYLQIDAAAPAFAAPFGDLFNGNTYTFQGDQYQHFGLKAVLSYHSWSRYLSEANSTSTPHGILQKNSLHAERVSEKTITRLMEQARSAATSHEARVLDFLRRHKSDYPLFKCGAPSKYKSGNKIRKIG